ncbi:MAG: OmpA family protein [Pseudomonadota bacterium]
MKKPIAIICFAALLTGCATEGGGLTKTQSGAIIGAVIGAAAGNQTGDSKKERRKDRIIGAALGAAAGAGIGRVLDQQEAELNQALEDERIARQVEVQRVREDLLRLTLDSEVSFDFDSADIKPAFRTSLNKVADVLIKYNQSQVTIVGHTDSIGSETYNQLLSERRAAAVENYLVTTGVSASRLSSRGAGESQPRETNDTEAGRQLNRRVEIFIAPDAAS